MSLSKRDVLKLCGAAFVASLVPDQLFKLLGARDLREAMERLDQWDLPAQAASNADYTTALTLPSGKTIWNGQLNTGMPDLYETHHMPRVPQFARTSYGGAVIAEWPDATDVPNQAWYALFAASFLADTSAGVQCKQGWFQFDHEDFPVNSQAARLASADKFVTLYNGIRAVLPNFKFGFYAYPNINKWATGGSGSAYNHGDPEYVVWQGEMEDMAAMYATDCEVVFPKLYIPYTRATDNPQTVSVAWKYAVHEIQDTYRMIRQYGHGQKVYPFINYHKNGDGAQAVLDFDVFQETTRLSYQLADGFLCWGGFTVAWSVESTLPWWTDVVEPIALGRKPGPLLR